MTIVIRPAQPTDKDAIARIHIEVGAATYRELLPDHYLDVIRPAEKTKLWDTRFEGGLDPEKYTLVVAEEHETLVGFLLFLLDEEQEYGTYLHHLYIQQSHQGAKLGQRLISAAITALPTERETAPVHLVALTGNTRAMAYYAKLGGHVIEQYSRPQSGGTDVELTRYQWPSANTLAQAAEKSLRLI